MFQDATEIAGGFTYPVIISALRQSGKVSAEMAAFVILNTDGWAVTCAHVFNRYNDAQRDEQAANDRQSQLDAINANPSLAPSRKQSLLKKIHRPDPEWINRVSYSWAASGATMNTIHLDPLADLALVELKGFPVDTVRNFPTFGNPAHHVRPGASLCRLGYPFNVLASSWDAAKGAFELSPGMFPLVLFPLEGMHTRTANYAESSAAGSRKATFLETSTPGLKGQSGGPIYDVEGTVWAIQSQTRHLELGFNPPVVTGGKTTVEHQFLNVGLGADVSEIVRFAAEKGVSITINQ